MNDTQLTRACERLTYADAQKLRRMVEEAREVIAEGYALQREAWDFYRACEKRT